jgi:hypothetical protein
MIAIATIRISELEQFRLLMWELRQLESDMRVGASPFAERLERSLDRFCEGTDDTVADEKDSAP